MLKVARLNDAKITYLADSRETDHLAVAVFQRSCWHINENYYH